jgi:hypothetical protein
MAMSGFHKSLMAATVLLACAALPVFGQGLVQDTLKFNINQPYELRTGNFVLPAGNYVLYQVNSNDPELFALYQGDRAHPPIAWVRTTRMIFAQSRYPEKAKVILEPKNENKTGHPVIEGWMIPGDDGWEIIAVPNHEHPTMLAKAK